MTTWHLEMLHQTQLRAPRRLASDLEVRRVELPSPALNRFFYTAIGGDWYWVDRLSWTYDQWRVWVEHPEVQTWTAWTQGSPVGYYELESQPSGHVELVYFGILPGFVGRGYGATLLAHAVDRAWALGASRVWVHTCSLDHPSARSSYEARGFHLFKEEVADVVLPEELPGPWPGAHG